MCRQNQMCGFALIAFGLGILIGNWLSGGFLCHCLGIGLVIFGFCVMHRK